MSEWIDILDSENHTFDNTTSGLAADTTKVAIDEIAAIPAFGVTAQEISNWNIAFGWGDHSVVGYLTTVSWGDITGVPIEFLPEAHDADHDTHNDGRYAPIVHSTGAGDGADAHVTALLKTNWNEAHGWGDHSTQNYITLTGVTYEALDTNGDVGQVANTVAAGDDNRFHDAITLAGTPDYLTLSGQEITVSQVDLAADVVGNLPAANVDFGTGTDTYVWTSDGVGGASWAASLSGGAPSVNLGTTYAANSVTVTNSAGTNAVIAAATQSDAGVLAASDKTAYDGKWGPGSKVDWWTTHLGRGGAGTYNVSGGVTLRITNTSSGNVDFVTPAISSTDHIAFKIIFVAVAGDVPIWRVNGTSMNFGALPAWVDGDVYLLDVTITSSESTIASSPGLTPIVTPAP